MIELKTPAEIELMRHAGQITAAALAAVRDAARVGMRLDELDAVAAGVIADAGAAASFLGYHGYPRSLCTSVNEQVVHGIPGPQVLAAGDVLSVDCGAVLDGWHGDAAFSVVVGEPADADPADDALVETTRRAMWAGIAALAPGLAAGARLGVVGDAQRPVVLVDHQAPHPLQEPVRADDVAGRPGP